MPAGAVTPPVLWLHLAAAVGPQETVVQQVVEGPRNLKLRVEGVCMARQPMTSCENPSQVVPLRSWHTYSGYHNLQMACLGPSTDKPQPSTLFVDVEGTQILTNTTMVAGSTTASQGIEANLQSSWCQPPIRVNPTSCQTRLLPGRQSRHGEGYGCLVLNGEWWGVKRYIAVHCV